MTLSVVSHWAQREQHLRARLAVNVRALRETQGSTVEEIAHEAAIHWRHWQKVEAGEVGVTLRTLAKLSLSLGVDASYLLR
jgi:transcriptional regulator with XRE-family HTH domain